MDLLRKLFWVALFCVFTFGFVVLFDHGFENYVENVKKDFASYKEYFVPTDKNKPKKPATL